MTGVYFPPASGAEKAASTPAASIPFNAQHTFAHGLGQAPDLIVPVLTCVTAEHGYSVGDRVIAVGFENGQSSGVVLGCDATNAWATLRTNLLMLPKTGGASQYFSAAKWEFHLEVWKLS